MGTFTRILGYAKRYWHLMALSFTLVVVDRFLTTYLPLVGTKAVIDTVLVQQHYDQLGFYLLLIIGMYSLRSLTTFGQRYINSYVSQRTVFDLRNEFFRTLQKKSFSFYDKTQTGQLMSRTTNDVERIRRFYAFLMTSLFGSVIQVLLVAYFLLEMDPRLTLIAVTTMPFVFVVNYRFMKKTRPLYQEIRWRFGVFSALLQQNIVGVKVVRVFTNENLERDNFTRENTAFLDLNVEVARQRAIHQPLTAFIMSLGVAIVYWYGGGEVIQNTLSLGALLVFGQYMMMLNGSVRFLGFLISMYGRALASAERVFEILDEEPEIRDQPGAYALSTVKGAVTFDHVSFEYLPGKPVLKDITLQVAPGETIAILGATGSGKSTLIYLLPRFYDVTRGTLSIDGTDVREVTLSSLRRRVGIVLQEVFLFSTTIKENIAFGKPDATMDEIEQAAKYAQAHDFIMAFPDGYDTAVGERGVTLSGGQKQRIAIARTLLMDPKILIFDDSTSFVDTRTEQALQRAIDTLLAGRTTFIITQRLSTVKNADRIIVLRDGEIVEMGSHSTLLAKKGIYSQIYETQFVPREEIRRLQPVGDGTGG
jgi:ABC-type multidrug transport system fused ATPase/permease subunit